MKIRLLGAALL